MGRYDTVAWQRIQTLCCYYGVKENDIKKKSKKILALYASLILFVHLDELPNSNSDLPVKTQLKALETLESISPEQSDADVVASLRGRIEDLWFHRLVEDAVVKLLEFPDGALYASILNKCYLTKWTLSEDALAQELDIERSRIYDRKRESVIMFGLCFWYYAIPKKRLYLLKE